MGKMNWKMLIYVILVFVYTIVLAIIQQVTNIDFEKITLPQIGPALAFFTIIILFRNLFIPIKININKIILLRILFSIIIPLALFTITYYIGKLMAIDMQINRNIFSTIHVMILGIIIGGIGEEIGWRSFFQPSLEHKYSVLISSIIVGLIWGLWHIGHYKNGLLFMVGFLIFTISASVIIVYLLKHTQNNLIISSLFHISINIGFIMFFSNNQTNTKLFLINGIIWLIPAIIIILSEKYYLIKAK
jgi:membrane protease YdiL (CAAX protease family)